MTVSEINAKLCEINAILASGVSTHTLDGETVAYDLDSLKAERRRLEQLLAAATGTRKSISATIDLSGWQ